MSKPVSRVLSKPKFCTAIYLGRALLRASSR